MLASSEALSLIKHVERAALLSSHEERVKVSPLGEAERQLRRLDIFRLETAPPLDVVSVFNQASLVQAQCGSTARARELCFAELRLCCRQNKITGRSDWLAHALQALINLRRLLLMEGHYEEALRQMYSLYAFGYCGAALHEETHIFDPLVSEHLARHHPDAMKVVANAYVVDSIRAHLGGRTPLELQAHVEFLRTKGLHESPVGCIVYEGDVRCRIAQGSHHEALAVAALIWWLARLRGEPHPILLCIFVDAMLATGQVTNALKTLDTVAGYADQLRNQLSVSQQKRLAYILCIRYLCCDRLESASVCLEKCMRFAEEQADQSLQCRLAIVRFVLETRRHRRGVSNDELETTLDRAARSCHFAHEAAMLAYVQHARGPFSPEAWERYASAYSRMHYQHICETGSATEERGLPLANILPKSAPATETSAHAVSDLFHKLMAYESRIG